MVTSVNPSTKEIQAKLGFSMRNFLKIMGFGSSYEAWGNYRRNPIFFKVQSLQQALFIIFFFIFRWWEDVAAVMVVVILAGSAQSLYCSSWYTNFCSSLFLVHNVGKSNGYVGSLCSSFSLFFFFFFFLKCFSEANFLFWI